MTSLYEAAIPPVRRALVNLGAILDKAAAHFQAEGVAEADWLGARLAPDMFSLIRQVQSASDAARFLASRLSGGTAPSMADEEKSVAELRDRIDRTIAYLDSLAPAAIDGREAEPVVVTLPKAEIRFTGASYLRDFGLPNFFFHIVTAYGILRHRGAPIGKLDYLGPLDMVRFE
ncbi:DUF1993 domain-containing protein [Rhizorhabdus dicambivorans]|uniref:DUF1993 domain-containing protein n=1 Tax=Rhizorhabdus dicambivorans TaxID=1850238 RepID=UPI000ABBA7AD|nr:DUF1993 domain-containing protein [Rhizorhabdus dicambivorans]